MLQNDELIQWIQQLASKDWRKAAVAEKQLSEAGEAGTEAVIERMSHPDSQVRRACTNFMEHLGHGRG